MTVPGQHVFSFMDPDDAKFRFPRLHRAVYTARFGSDVYRRRFVDASDGLRGDMAWTRDRHTNYRAADVLSLLVGAGFIPQLRDGANLFWRFIQIPAVLAPDGARHVFDRPSARGRPDVPPRQPVLHRGLRRVMTGAPLPQQPNFIYIGPDKAGSSWLHEVLRRHPQVFMPPAKGLYFFDRYYDRGLSWYLSQFTGARPEHLVRGEVCQDYLFHPDAPDRMAESLGALRMMVTLRDPADRAFSSYLHMLRSGWEPVTFDQALDRYPELIEHGRYATHLDRFVQRFGRDSVYIAVFDDLQADPQTFVDGLISWLGIDSMTLDAGLLEARLPAGRARSTLVSRLVSSGAALARERDRGDLVGRIKRSRAVQRTLYRTLTSDRPEMTSAERLVVQQRLAGEVSALDDTYGLRLARRWNWPVAGPAGRASASPNPT